MRYLSRIAIQRTEEARMTPQRREKMWKAIEMLA
jgi:hypothetical protein